MKAIRVLSVLLALLATARLALADELPPPPRGFSWQEIPELKAAFLRPDGWHFVQRRKEDVLGLFITREDLGAKGSFDTGLTINVMRKLEGRAALTEAESFIRALAAKNGSEVSEKTLGPFRGFSCRARAKDATGVSITHNLMVANPRTNTLYLFIFESREQDWTAAWSKGEVMLKLLLIDDTI